MAFTDLDEHIAELFSNNTAFDPRASDGFLFRYTPKMWKAKRHARGLCSKGCGRPLATRWLCAECAAKGCATSRRWGARNVAFGRCRLCKAKRVNKNHCARHRDYLNAKKRQYRAAGRKKMLAANQMCAKEGE